MLWSRRNWPPPAKPFSTRKPMPTILAPERRHRCITLPEAWPSARKSSINRIRSSAVRKRRSMQTVVLSLRVKDHTHDCHVSPTLLGIFFLINTTGRFIRYPVRIAGAIPDASMVTILFIPLSLNRRANSCAQCIMSWGSSWWLRKLPTITTPPSAFARPSWSILCLSSSILICYCFSTIVLAPSKGTTLSLYLRDTALIPLQK